MTDLPTLRAARDAADTRWHDAAVAAREAELAVRAASDDEREAAQMALDAAMSAERDAEGAYIAAAGAHLDALHATYPPGREDEAAVKVCEQDHGGKHNDATVYGHHASVRICIRLRDTDEWVYDPAWETQR